RSNTVELWFLAHQLRRRIRTRASPSWANIRDRFTKFRLTRTATLSANRTALLRTKSLEKRPSRRLRAMPNKTLFPDGESKSVVLVHRIRLRLLNLGRHLGQVVVHLTLRKYRLMRRHRAN